MTIRPLDTDAGSWSTYNMVLDGMDGATRLRAAVELSEAVREIRLAGIHAEHPHLNRRETVARLVLEEFGVELPGER